MGRLSLMENLMLNNLPKVKGECISEVLDSIRKSAENQKLQEWLNNILNWLQANNNELYKFVTERSQKFAIGAMMAGDPQSLAISHMLELIIFLRVIDVSIEKVGELTTFDGWLNNMLGGQTIEGLDTFNQEDNGGKKDEK